VHGMCSQTMALFNSGDHHPITINLKKRVIISMIQEFIKTCNFQRSPINKSIFSISYTQNENYSNI